MDCCSGRRAKLVTSSEGRNGYPSPFPSLVASKDFLPVSVNPSRTFTCLRLQGFRDYAVCSNVGFQRSQQPRRAADDYSTPRSKWRTRGPGVLGSSTLNPIRLGQHCNRRRFRSSLTNVRLITKWMSWRIRFPPCPRNDSSNSGVKALGRIGTQDRAVARTGRLHPMDASGAHSP